MKVFTTDIYTVSDCCEPGTDAVFTYGILYLKFREHAVPPSQLYEKIYRSCKQNMKVNVLFCTEHG